MHPFSEIGSFYDSLQQRLHEVGIQALVLDEAARRLAFVVPTIQSRNSFELELRVSAVRVLRIALVPGVFKNIHSINRSLKA